MRLNPIAGIPWATSTMQKKLRPKIALHFKVLCESKATLPYWRTLALIQHCTVQWEWPQYHLHRHSLTLFYTAGWAGVSCCFYCPKLCIQKRTPFCCPYVHSYCWNIFECQLNAPRHESRSMHIASATSSIVALKSFVPVVFFSHPSFGFIPLQLHNR